MLFWRIHRRISGTILSPKVIDYNNADYADAAFGCAARRCHSLTLVTCCRSRFGAALRFISCFGDHKAAATAGFAAGKTATGRAGEACL
ncbi:hypothetical protein J6C36_03170, partial [Methanocorpusculaceae archaeon]|nr:hypothetical protein [Methanocorpusculaceae archaeon]